MPKERHAWSVEDDIVALYLYRFRDKDLPLSTEEIGHKLGMGEVSLRMRIGNFKSLDGGRGLDNFSKQSKKVYEENKEAPQADLKARVLRVLSKN